MKIIATFFYIAFIIVLNWMFAVLPHVSLFGGSLSPADVMVGFVYLLRDFAQREIRHYVIVAMVVGSVISYFMANPAIALASVSAFVVGEMIDWAVFTWTKRPLSKRLLFSASLSAPFDSAVFLYMIARLDWLSLTVMTLGKLAGVLLLWKCYLMRHKKKPPPLGSTGTTSVGKVGN